MFFGKSKVDHLKVDLDLLAGRVQDNYYDMIDITRAMRHELSSEIIQLENSIGEVKEEINTLKPAYVIEQQIELDEARKQIKALQAELTELKKAASTVGPVKPASRTVAKPTETTTTRSGTRSNDDSISSMVTTAAIVSSFDSSSSSSSSSGSSSHSSSSYSSSSYDCGSSSSDGGGSCGCD